MSVTRRQFLKLSGGAAAGAAALGIHHPAQARYPATLPYPRQAIAKAEGLKTGVPVSFTYPDPDSPCLLIKLGERVPGGVGPEGDIVAYSALCAHKGCPLAFDPEAATLKCPCHFSIFDPAKEGQQVCGQATQNLPRIVLEYAQGDLIAVAVDGLIYGRQANIL